MRDQLTGPWCYQGKCRSPAMGVSKTPQKYHPQGISMQFHLLQFGKIFLSSTPLKYLLPHWAWPWEAWNMRIHNFHATAMLQQTITSPLDSALAPWWLCFLLALPFSYPVSQKLNDLDEAHSTSCHFSAQNFPVAHNDHKTLSGLGPSSCSGLMSFCSPLFLILL